MLLKCLSALLEMVVEVNISIRKQAPSKPISKIRRIKKVQVVSSLFTFPLLIFSVAVKLQFNMSKKCGRRKKMMKKLR